MKMNYVKNVEIAEAYVVPGTYVHVLVMKDGTKYYCQHDLVQDRELYPGEFNKRVPVIARRLFQKDPDNYFKYVRVYFDRHVYIHESDLRDYILIRQARCESGGTGNGLRCFWCIEAAALIKKLFGIKVCANHKHMKTGAPKEIWLQFENNKKLRTLWQSYEGILNGLKTQKTLANYWPQMVELENQLTVWKDNNEVEGEEA